MPLRILISCLFAFFAITLFGQNKAFQSFSANTSGCLTKYILDKDGFYFTSISCQQSTTVAFGRYTIKVDDAYFKPLSFDSLPAFISITESAAKNDTTSQISFVCRYKKSIPDKGFAIDAIDTSGKFYKRLFLDSNGCITINPHRFTKLRTNYLDHFYAKWVYIEAKPANLLVQLSLPVEFITPDHPRGDIRSGYKLKLNRDGLYNGLGQLLATAEE